MYTTKQAKDPLSCPKKRRRISIVKPPRTHASQKEKDGQVTAGESPAVSNPFGEKHHSEQPRHTDSTGRKLPAALTREVGFFNRLGNLCYDLALLARAAELQARYGGCTDPLEYEQGFTVEQYPGEFIQSLEAIARPVFARLFKTAAFPDTSIVSHLLFHTRIRW